MQSLRVRGERGRRVRKGRWADHRMSIAPCQTKTTQNENKNDEARDESEIPEFG